MVETRVGFCGLGTMGAAMAANVARAGFPLTVWNRTPGKAAGAVSAGAVEALSPSAVASLKFRSGSLSPTEMVIRMVPI